MANIFDHIFDDLINNGQGNNERAYNEGRRDAENASGFDKALHNSGDELGSVLPMPSSAEYNSYEAGYHSADNIYDDDDD